MTRYISGLFTASILLIFLHIYGAQLLGVLMRRGDNSDWGHQPKQPVYRHMTGRMPNE